MHKVYLKVQKVIIHWFPSHCGIHGNKVADILAKEGESELSSNQETNKGKEQWYVQGKRGSVYKGLI